MKDELLLELKEKITTLEKQDASFVHGFITMLNIFSKAFDESGTPIQKCLLSYISEEVGNIYNTKSHNGKFKHIIK